MRLQYARIFGLLAVLGPGIPTATSAQGDPGGPASISLAEALERFHRTSPELVLARIRLRHALAESRQSRAVPNPVVSFTSEDLGEYSERYLNLTQRVDFLWTTGARGRRADARAIAAHARLQADSAQLALDLKRAYMHAWSAAARVESLRSTDDIVKELLAAANERFLAGDLAGYDVRRLSVERGQVSRRLAQAELDLTTSEVRLGALVTGDGFAPIGADARLGGAPHPGPGFDAVGQAMVRRAEIVAGGAAMDDRAASLGLARATRLSGTSLTGGLKRQSDGRNGAFFGVQIPIPLLDRRGGAVDAARAELDGATAEVELIRRAIGREALVALARLEAAQRMRAMMGEGGVDEGDQLLEIARLAYAEGELGIVEVLDAAETYLEARLMSTAVRLEDWLAFFELERAVGGLPEVMDTGEER